MRESGYYWVKLLCTWRIANYNKTKLKWTIVAYDGTLFDLEFMEIDEKQIKRND